MKMFTRLHPTQDTFSLKTRKFTFLEKTLFFHRGDVNTLQKDEKLGVHPMLKAPQGREYL